MTIDRKNKAERVRARGENPFANDVGNFTVKRWPRQSPERDRLSDLLRTWARTFEYYWVGNKIVHPLSIEETKLRKRLYDNVIKFMSRPTRLNFEIVRANVRYCVVMQSLLKLQEKRYSLKPATVAAKHRFLFKSITLPSM